MGPLRRSRIEYVDWCVNWRRGCGHGCTYCYAAGMAHRFGKTPDGGWTASELVFDEPGRSLSEQLRRKRAPVEGMVLVSSSHDPFAPGGDDFEARMVVLQLGATSSDGTRGSLWPQTMILTKSPRWAVTVLERMGAGPGGLWLGTSLTSLSRDLTRVYEPGAESPADRLRGMQEAAQLGYRTWLSLEPPLPGVVLTQLVTAVRLALDEQPWLVLGKMNYRSGECRDLRTWSKSQHWALDRDAAVGDLVREGYVESLSPRAGGYWVKRELSEWGRPTGGA